MYFVRIGQDDRPLGRQQQAKLQPRVLHIVSSLKVGGMEQFVTRIASAQQQRGLLVAVLALRDGPLRSTLLARGLPVQHLGGRGLLGRVLGAIAFCRRYEPDVIHVHNTSSLQYGALCGGLLRRPFIMTYHGQGSGAPRLTTDFEWRSVALVVCVSEAAMREIARHVSPSRLEVVHNGVELPPPSDRNRRDQLRQALGIGQGHVALTVARMDGYKGHSDLLKALALLRDRNAGITALLAGDGSERPALEREARALHLDSASVRFLGFREDVLDLLEAADIFVLPSLTEGMPLSLLEAMARGTPAVATTVGGIPELAVNEHHALLVPSRAPEALASAMERLLGNRHLQQALAQAALARVIAEFSFSRMLERYDEIYERLVTH